MFPERLFCTFNIKLADINYWANISFDFATFTIGPRPDLDILDGLGYIIGNLI